MGLNIPFSNCCGLLTKRGLRKLKTKEEILAMVVVCLQKEVFENFALLPIFRRFVVVCLQKEVFENPDYKRVKNEKVVVCLQKEVFENCR